MTTVEETMDGAVAEMGAIARLSGLDPISYDRVRHQEADSLGIRVGTLDKLVADQQPAEPEAGAGRTLEWPEPEPWPDTVDGAELLTDLAATFTRFVVLPPACDTALALWVLHVHAFKASAVTPRLQIKSPALRCGKTTTLEILQTLVPRPLIASSITASRARRS